MDFFHSKPRGIQVWAAMAFTRPVTTIMKLDKSKSTFLNVFNYLHLHVEGDDCQAALLCSEYRDRFTVIQNKIIKQLKCKEDMLNGISFEGSVISKLLK